MKEVDSEPPSQPDNHWLAANIALCTSHVPHPTSSSSVRARGLTSACCLPKTSNTSHMFYGRVEHSHNPSSVMPRASRPSCCHHNSCAVLLAVQSLYTPCKHPPIRKALGVSVQRPQSASLHCTATDQERVLSGQSLDCPGSMQCRQRLSHAHRFPTSPWLLRHHCMTCCSNTELRNAM